MPFTEKETQIIQAIFKHLAPRTIEPVQLFTPDQKNHTDRTFGVYNRRREWVYLFQYFKNLSKPRLKILEKRKKEVNHEIYIVQSTPEIVCIGWKCK